MHTRPVRRYKSNGEQLSGVPRLQLGIGRKTAVYWNRRKAKIHHLSSGLPPEARRVELQAPSRRKAPPPGLLRPVLTPRTSCALAWLLQYHSYTDGRQLIPLLCSSVDTILCHLISLAIGSFYTCWRRACSLQPEVDIAPRAGSPKHEHASTPAERTLSPFSFISQVWERSIPLSARSALALHLVALGEG